MAPRMPIPDLPLQPPTNIVLGHTTAQGTQGIPMKAARQHRLKLILA